MINETEEMKKFAKVKDGNKESYKINCLGLFSHSTNLAELEKELLVSYGIIIPQDAQNNKNLNELFANALELCSGLKATATNYFTNSMSDYTERIRQELKDYVIIDALFHLRKIMSYESTKKTDESSVKAEESSVKAEESLNTKGGETTKQADTYSGNYNTINDFLRNNLYKLTNAGEASNYHKLFQIFSGSVFFNIWGIDVKNSSAKQSYTIPKYMDELLFLLIKTIKKNPYIRGKFIEQFKSSLSSFDKDKEKGNQKVKGKNNANFDQCIIYEVYDKIKVFDRACTVNRHKFSEIAESLTENAIFQCIKDKEPQKFRFVIVEFSDELWDFVSSKSFGKDGYKLLCDIKYEIDMQIIQLKDCFYIDNVLIEQRSHELEKSLLKIADLLSESSLKNAFCKRLLEGVNNRFEDNKLKGSLWYFLKDDMGIFTGFSTLKSFLTDFYSELESLYKNNESNENNASNKIIAYYLADRFFDTGTMVYLVEKLSEIEFHMNPKLIIEGLAQIIMIPCACNKFVYIDLILKILTSQQKNFTELDKYKNDPRIIAHVSEIKMPVEREKENLEICTEYILYMSTVYLPMLNACFYILASRAYLDDAGFDKALLECLNEKEFINKHNTQREDWMGKMARFTGEKQEHFQQLYILANVKLYNPQDVQLWEQSTALSYLQPSSPYRQGILRSVIRDKVGISSHTALPKFIDLS